jgi:hypothetical protein
LPCVERDQRPIAADRLIGLAGVVAEPGFEFDSDGTATATVADQKMQRPRREVAPREAIKDAMRGGQSSAKPMPAP